MGARLKKLGVVVAILGLLFVLGAGIAAYKVKQGSDALGAFAAEQNVNLRYDEDGNFLSGDAEESAAILSLVRDDWKYPVNMSELDPNDPLVNTGTEYMYQMATITHHVIDQTVTVTLAEDTDFNGETLKAGDYEVDIAGKYWADFDRSNPLEGLARGQAWSDTALALSGQLGVGAVTASTLQMGYGISALIGGLGLIFLFTGGLMFWIAMPSKETDGAAKPAV
jgi:hypothetical protein